MNAAKISEKVQVYQALAQNEMLNATAAQRSADDAVKALLQMKVAPAS